MSPQKTFYVYILASRSRTLYIGVTGNFHQRLSQHRAGQHDSFTRSYNITRLVCAEPLHYINNAITRGKQLEGWLRSRKIALIEERNPTWEDLLPLREDDPSS